ncbi:MAG: phenylalanine--tRNA ligase subunit alpha, partial [Bacillota bacterium]|nr:phenylalanine--tRNA ligase subunit alpha [Bacillota bacterium]
MLERLEAIAQEIESSLARIDSLEQLEELRIRYLGKKGILT